MRICVEKSTGKLIEMQSDATEGTLIRNAVAAGYNEVDIEEKETTAEEYQAMLDAQPKPQIEPTIEERNRADIDYLAIMTGVGLDV
jgi:hypothetical protein